MPQESSHLVYKNNKYKINCESAIAQPLVQIQNAPKHIQTTFYGSLGKQGSSFHLRVLESVYIKTQNPVLCRQKEFVVSLGLFK